jgi:hypothetical protein
MTYAANLAAQLRAEVLDATDREGTTPYLTAGQANLIIRAVESLEGPPDPEDAARGLVQQLREVLARMPLTDPRLEGTLHTMWGGVLDGIEMAVTVWAERQPRHLEKVPEPVADPPAPVPQPVPPYGVHRAESEFLDALREPPT